MSKFAIDHAILLIAPEGIEMTYMYIVPPCQTPLNRTRRN